MERLPQPDQLIKMCTDAGFLKTVEVGQYLMTKRTEPVTCREYILPRDENSPDLEMTRQLPGRLSSVPSVMI